MRAEEKLSRIRELIDSDVQWLDSDLLQDILDDDSPIDQASGLSEKEMKAKYVRFCSYCDGTGIVPGSEDQVWVKGLGWA